MTAVPAPAPAPRRVSPRASAVRSDAPAITRRAQARLGALLVAQGLAVSTRVDLAGHERCLMAYNLDRSK